MCKAEGGYAQVEIKAPSRQELAEVEPLIRKDEAGRWLYDWMLKQGVAFDGLEEIEVLEMVMTAKTVFIHCINYLFELRKEHKVKDTETIRKRNIILRKEYNIDPDTLTDEEWAILNEDIEWLHEMRMRQFVR